MSEIELIIKIPEEDFEIMKHNIAVNNPLCPLSEEEMVSRVAKGIPLPKGHGDLIDKSKIYKAIPAEEDNCTGMGMTYDEMYAYNDGIDAMYDLVQDAKTIIEADNAENDAKTKCKMISNVLTAKSHYFEETESILDKIKAEIEQLPTNTRTNWDGCCPDIDYPEIEYVDVSKDKLLSIIDKYKSESER